jgi:hypothetical protein
MADLVGRCRKVVIYGQPRTCPRCGFVERSGVQKLYVHADRDEATGEWRIELQSKVRGIYPLTVTWEQPWNVKEGALELMGLEAAGGSIRELE